MMVPSLMMNRISLWLLQKDDSTSGENQALSISELEINDRIDCFEEVIS
jgi:hypothetical protein